MAGRLSENNMFYRVGEKIKIKSKDSLRGDGMEERAVRAIKHLCGRVFRITRIDENYQSYAIEGSKIQVVDADIDHIVL